MLKEVLGLSLFFCHGEQEEGGSAGWKWQLSPELRALLCSAAGGAQLCAVGQPCPQL